MNYKGSLKKNTVIDKNLKAVRKTQDPRFGEVTIYQEPKSKSLIACKSFNFNDEKLARELMGICQGISKLNSPYICRLLDFGCEMNKELCSSSFIVNQFYEFPHIDLKKETINRDKHVRFFNNDELLQILYQQIAAMKMLEENKLFHGDLRPLYIGLNRDLFTSKLILQSDDIKNKRDILQIQQNHYKFNDILYLSPQLYEAIASNNLKIYFDPIKEDMFALGLIMLELSTGLLLQDLYGKNLKFDFKSFDYVLKAFKEMFSDEEDQLFYSTVLTMLEIDVRDRPGFIEISKRMPPYEVVKEYISGRQPNYETNVSKNDNKTYIVENDTKTDIDYTSTNNTIKYGYTINEQNWRPQIEHVYRRADRSVEKPKVIPYLDEESVQIVMKDPFTPHSSHSIIKSNRSNYSISKSPNHSNSRYGEKKLIKKVVRTIEEVDGKLFEKIENYAVTDSDRLIKTNDQLTR